MKKVLYTSNPFQAYPRAIKKTLEIFAQVDGGSETFLGKSGDFDWIVIDWPEDLFGWQKITSSDVQKVSNVLQFWKKRAKLLMTRHNHPPRNQKSARFKLDELMYSSADVILHLGECSYDRYRVNCLAPSQQHVIIPHVDFDYETDVSQADSRRLFNLSDDDFVLLVFGQIRSKKEWQLVKQSFDAVPFNKKKLLISRFPKSFLTKKLRSSRAGNALFGRANHGITKICHRLDSRYRIYYDRVPEEDVKYFVSASDVVFIPRFENLNSGLVPLAYRFSKPAVGTMHGNIGSLLQETGNPTFNPADQESVKLAMERLSTMDLSTQGKKNRQFMLDHCQPIHIARELQKIMT